METIVKELNINFPCPISFTDNMLLGEIMEIAMRERSKIGFGDDCIIVYDVCESQLTSFIDLSEDWHFSLFDGEMKNDCSNQID